MRWLLFIPCLLSLISSAQTSARPAPSDKYDLPWVRAFASSIYSYQDDPRFRVLLQRSFPQQQRFWRDYGKFYTVPELATVFLGVPEAVSVDRNRFVTIDGCVPRDCGDRGMVWIDTKGSGKPLVFFVVPQTVSTTTDEKAALQHLWIYSSRNTNWQRMPPEFTASLVRWYTTYRATWMKYYRLDAAMVTLVGPNGLTYDLSPGVLALPDSCTTK